MKIYQVPRSGLVKGDTFRVANVFRSHIYPIANNMCVGKKNHINVSRSSLFLFDFKKKKEGFDKF